MFLSFDVNKIRLSEDFQGIITPEKVNCFRNKLVRLIKKHKEDPRLLTFLKAVLETLNQRRPAENLQSKTYASDATQTDASNTTVKTVALSILLPEKMKTMVRSTIRALESNHPQMQLRSIIVSKDFSMQEERLSQEVLGVIHLISKEYTDLTQVDSCEVLIIRLFQGVADRERRVDILRAIRKIPEAQRIDIITEASPFFQSITDGFERADLLRVMQEIPPDQRNPAVIRAAAFLLEGIEDGYRRADILRAIGEIPVTLRSDVIEKTVPFLEDIADGYQRADILRAVGEVPEDERSPTVIRATAFLLEGIEDGYRRADILRVIREIPVIQRAGVIVRASSSFQSITDGGERAELLRAMKKIPSDSKTPTAVQTTAFLLQDVTDESQKADILRAMEKIPPNRRTSPVIRAVIALFQGITNDYQRGMLLREIEVIPAMLRSDVIEKSFPCFYGITRSHEAVILEAVKEIPSDLRSDVIEKATPVLLGISDGCKRADILRIIAKIPKNQRTPVVMEATVSLFQDIEHSKRRDILKAIAKIPSDQRIFEVIRALVSLFQDGESSGEDIIKAIEETSSDLRSDAILRVFSILRGISSDRHILGAFRKMVKIPADQRSDAIEKAEPLFKDIKNGSDRMDILLVMQEIPSNQRTDVIEKASSLFQSPMSVHRKSAILRVMGEILPDQRADVIEQAVVLFQDTTDGLQKARVLQVIGDIPPDQRTPAVNRSIISLLQGSESDSLRRAFHSAPADRRVDAAQFSLSCKSLAKEDSLTAYADIPSGESFQNWKQVLVQIDKIHAPSLQVKTLAVFRRAAKDPKTRELFESSTFGALFEKESTQIFRLFVAEFWQDHLLDDSLNATAVVLHSKGFKDVDRKKNVLRAFTILSEVQDLNSIEKGNILKIIFSKEEIRSVPALKKCLERSEGFFDLQEKKSDRETARILPETEKNLINKINKSLLVTEAMCNFGKSAELRKIGESKDLKTLLESVLKEALGMKEVPDFSDRYVKTFGSFRDAASLPVYMSKLATLDLPEKTQALQCLTSYVEGVLTGTFPALRYEETSSVHLAKVFEGRQTLKRKWMAGRELDFEEPDSLKQEDSGSHGFSAKEYLEQRVLNDEHISHEKIPYLAARLKGKAPEETDFFAPIQNRSQDAKHRDFDLLRLQKGIISLLQSTNEEQYEIFRSKVEPFIETALLEEERFKADLASLGKMLAPRRKETSFSGWKVVDTDDPQDLLLCGTEVEGSCQNIRGDPEYNKCLLAYLLDGKNRLIAVKDDKGRIIARSILRLLWDETRRIPVLFKERVYKSSHADPKVSVALDRMCILRAQELQLPLVARNSFALGASVYLNELESLGSTVPFEYSDAGGGVTNGRFKVKGVLLTMDYS